jgi:hypothetical protein
MLGKGLSVCKINKSTSLISILAYNLQYAQVINIKLYVQVIRITLLLIKRRPLNVNLYFYIKAIFTLTYILFC